MKSIAIIGGGISGLAAAWELRGAAAKRTVEVELIESRDRLGGAIETDTSRGYVIEGGPDSFLTRKTQARQLCEEAGLGSDLIAPLQGSSYIYHKGRFHPIPPVTPEGLPRDLRSFRKSQLFSPWGKLRAMLDLVLPRTAALRNGWDVSIGTFMRRRLGGEVTDTLIAPLVGGTHLTHVDHLSLRSVLPGIVEMEERDRSLILGLMKARSGGSPTTAGGGIPFTTLKGGLTTLVEAIARQLPPVRVSGSTRVVAVRRLDDGRYGITRGAGPETTHDGVILSTPAQVNSTLLKDSFPALAERFRAIRYSPVIVVGMVYGKKDVPLELDRAGFMVPKGEGLAISGVTYATSKWAYALAGPGTVLRVFLDNRNDRGATDLDDAGVMALVRRDLQTTLGITTEPAWSRVFRHPGAMPQYRVGHGLWVEEVRRLAATWKGMTLAGGLYEGVGLSDCIRTGRVAAREVLGTISGDRDVAG